MWHACRHEGLRSFDGPRGLCAVFRFVGRVWIVDRWTDHSERAELGCRRNCFDRESGDDNGRGFDDADSCRQSRIVGADDNHGHDADVDHDVGSSDDRRAAVRGQSDPLDQVSDVPWRDAEQRRADAARHRS